MKSEKAEDPSLPSQVRPGEDKKRCSYTFFSGDCCSFEAPETSSLCFWHDPTPDKNSPKVSQTVAKYVRKGGNLEGFVLRGVNLEYADLYNAKLARADLRDARFYGASLTNAHMFGADLRGASLFKTCLVEANLKGADLRGANLLSAKLDGVLIDGVKWGRNYIIQNEKDGDAARKKGDIEEARKKYKEAEEIYHRILNNYREFGNLVDAGSFFYREMIMKRKQFPLWSGGRFWSWLADAMCGYGEKPIRVILSSLILIVVCAIIYSVTGIAGIEGYPEGRPISIFQVLQGDAARLFQIAEGASSPETGSQDNGTDKGSWIEALNIFEHGLYLSMVTVTRTNIVLGDLRPSSAGARIAAAEAFTGTFMMALFVLVFGRKMMR